MPAPGSTATTSPSAWWKSRAIGVSSDDLAGNLGVLVERVDRAQAVVAVGDHHLAMRLVAHEEQRRELLAVADLLAVLFNVLVADAEQRKARSAEDVLR